MMVILQKKFHRLHYDNHDSYDSWYLRRAEKASQ